MSQLKHHEIQAMVQGLSENKVFNLDASIRQMIEPIAKGLQRNPGEEISLHVLCCNEYALVTGLQASRIDEIESIANSLKAALSQIGASNKA